MRWVATGILAVLLVVYLLTFTVAEPAKWVLLIRAMAEAGMIGGLADWFAVEALFRRPLGLPIPHTALLPNNQKRAARNIARFIDEYFLGPEQLIAKVRELGLVPRALAWLERPENAKVVAGELVWALRVLTRNMRGAGLPPKARDLLIDLVADTTSSRSFDARVSELLRHALDTNVLDEVLDHVRRTIDSNRPAIVRLVEERSRWWIASGVDRQVANLLVDGILSVLDDLADPNKSMRSGFTDTVGRIVEQFRKDRVISRFVSETLQDPEMRADIGERVNAMMLEVIDRLDARVEEDPKALSDVVVAAVTSTAAQVAGDAETLDALNHRLEEALTRIIGESRPMIRGYIVDTISQWDSADLVARLEAEVGRDLQFIRINGAALGAALGGVFFVFSHFVLGG